MRAEYAYDLKSHHEEYFHAQAFAVDSVEGHAIGFDVLTSFGAMFARLPISALVHKEHPVHLPLHFLQIWNNFSYDVEAVEYRALRNLRVTTLLKDKTTAPGSYLFTLSWLRSATAEQPGEGGFKRAHIIALDCGCYTAQPNNRLVWHEPSFITQPFPDNPDFLTNSHLFQCEDHEKWATENSDRFFYQYRKTDDH